MSSAQSISHAPDAMPDTAPLMELKNASLSFAIGGSLLRPSRLQALTEVSFQLHAGRSLALVGESGSGKSTCARVLARIYKPSAGSALFEGENVADLKKSAAQRFRQDVQMIFQDPFGSLNQTHSIGYILERPLKLHRKKLGDFDVAERIEALLLQVGLSPAKDFMRRRPHELSGGQRQRVSIARALSVRPKVLLADEPTSMLDVSVRLGILNLLEQQKSERALATLFITHDIATARYFAEDTAVLYAGHLVEYGPSDQITSDPHHPYTQLLIDSVPNPERRISKSGPRTSLDIPLWTTGKTGCPFASRCPLATQVCREHMPDPKAKSAGHFVRCHNV
jgi:peptide/nickel transport system ATP-binding protein